ncbi:hypothetical protein PHYBLDRAFT_158653 [Phycomyces blakesleeanus NRRL 1555(-)]|uniref:Uncharacterized protein n=1 Tax=Phycomyces blakesleeanus (strain ATCC 8743b / DSM 1359 / FGSC 10004 / NBRC 33097 / NRRL 1555) TaxID=763407 RepID=A0A162XDZ6_PHYB8|nr:hypothetical protein PHYBLDRAFT_158653 [Phycomyces blakesleeanus NRRL 1555(-)]OAD74225.1 hypothetical protein PHYBLDRAFT_158653 [Phycomyces blakesleeanus NRRL 1555(-)]|eukprot:XP_018292265.1 hypothetical protein PHYBLDRAFT_158653 [Phycomyces blakesleeanus NRRL 1555(-)]
MNGFVLCANFDIFVLVLVCPKKELNIYFLKLMLVRVKKKEICYGCWCQF